MNDLDFFLLFSFDYECFEEREGFGSRKKSIMGDWWKDFKWNWQELSE